MALFKNVNGIDIALSPEEEAEHRLREIEFESQKYERAAILFDGWVSGFVHAQASVMRYNSAESLLSYLNSTVEDWRNEAQAFSLWRDTVWLCAIECLKNLKENHLDIPDYKQFIEKLPEFSFPKKA